MLGGGVWPTYLECFRQHRQHHHELFGIQIIKCYQDSLCRLHTQTDTTFQTFGIHHKTVHGNLFKLTGAISACSTVLQYNNPVFKV